ncbi:MAG TPA: hypothetical protein PLZ98_07715 [Chitinophagaceae bacterium]|nr:hypothetical protein [Chitinophagaceae bacterium]
MTNRIALIPAVFIKVLAQIGLLMLFSQLIRLTFFLIHASYFSVSSWQEYGMIVFYSLRFDLSSIFTINFVYIALTLLPFTIMNKKIHELIRADVIRAVIPKNGEHTVIILEDYQEVKHIKCINCCSFSSHPSSKKEKLRYISIEGIKVPNFIFEIKKDFTHMRID